MRIIHLTSVCKRCLLATLSLVGLADLSGQSPLEQSPAHRRVDSLRLANKKAEAFNWLAAEKARLEQQNRRESPDYLAVLWAAGYLQLKSRNFKEARPALQEALELHQKISPEIRENEISLNSALGDCYLSTDPQTAVIFYEKNLTLRLSISGDNTQSAATGYYEMASIYLSLGRYEKATDNCQKAIRCLKNAGLTRHPDFGGYHHFIGLINQEEGDFPEALKYYQLALPLLQASLGEHVETATCLNTMGQVYARLNQFDKALESQLASVKMFERVDTLSGSHLRAGLYTLGVTYNLAGQPRKALEAFQRNQSLGAKPGVKKPMGWRLPMRMSESYRQLGDYPQALALADTALASLGTVKGINRLYLWHACLTKARVLATRFKQEKETQTLAEAGRWLTRAQDIMSAMFGEFSGEQNKMALYREFIQGFDLSIDTYLQLFELSNDPDWLRTAFEFSERGKCLLQYQQMLESRASRQAIVPEVLTREEKMQRERITEAKKQLFELGEGADSPHADSLREQLFVLNQRYEQVGQKIQEYYPGYFSETTAFPSLPFETLQKSLPPCEGLLEFFAGDTVVTAFLLLRDTLLFHKISGRKNLETLISQLRESISRYHLSPQKNSDQYLRAAADYAAAAHELYQTLLAPLAPHVPRRLTVVPDGMLAYLPFEALLVEKPERPDRFHLHHYLAKDVALRYAGSAALLREMENLPPAPPTPERLLALAPFFDNSTPWRDSLLALRTRSGRTDVSPLPYSGEEVFKIAKMIGGKALTGTEATKRAFLREAARYPVLHLATHAQANDIAGDYSFLVFAPDSPNSAPERMYVSEIYGLPLRAELVTLSACETGLGQMYRGEGIVSVARAFASAGARSIVQTQWAVSDAQTQHFMELFYKNLQKRLPKDVALQKARQEYWSRYRGEEAHPYFWAGFLLIGDNRPLSF